MGSGLTWGIVATVKATAREILDFAAHHADLGAHRIHLFLDAPCPEAMPHLKAHPKVRVTLCDAAYWSRTNGWRPRKHQVRQTLNATRAYPRAEVDWLAHIDADEFLWPETDIVSALDGLEGSVARVRPVEALAGSTRHFKAMVGAGDAGLATAAELYPSFHAYLKRGFLSHVQGKVFVHTGLPEIEIRIHNAFQHGASLPAPDVDALTLLHCHTGNWDAWRTRYAYRLESGSYRAELQPALPRAAGGVTLHEVFSAVEAEEGEAGLRRIFDEIAADTPEHRTRLEAAGLLRHIPLDLDSARRKQFPGYA